jgi:hypothetical protein
MAQPKTQQRVIFSWGTTMNTKAIVVDRTEFHLHLKFSCRAVKYFNANNLIAVTGISIEISMTYMGLPDTFGILAAP